MEFYIVDDELWCKTSSGSVLVDESCTDIVNEMYSHIRDLYPHAMDAMMKTYKKSSFNVPYYKYLIVRRFCKCNFGALDTTKEDYADNVSCFEKVHCPLRGECIHEGVICMPKMNTKMSKAEHRVMRMVYDGRSNEDIARELCLSPMTIKNHIKNVYAKLGIHRRSEFLKYANDNNIFN